MKTIILSDTEAQGKTLTMFKVLKEQPFESLELSYPMIYDT